MDSNIKHSIRMLATAIYLVSIVLLIMNVMLHVIAVITEVKANFHLYESLTVALYIPGQLFLITTIYLRTQKLWKALLYGIGIYLSLFLILNILTYIEETFIPTYFHQTF